MRVTPVIFFILVLTSCANGKETNYTGSTPAHSQFVRMFLGIPKDDSVDFIRWKLQITDRDFALHCNYGIGKPNTSGFINGGKSISFNGKTVFEKGRYTLVYNNRQIRFMELNDDLLHFTDSDFHLLIGTAGWSYTLNRTGDPMQAKIKLESKPFIIRDSISFVGRTPCQVNNQQDKSCYKLKWRIIFYPGKTGEITGRYKIYGTLWRKEEPKTGNWKAISVGKGEFIYQVLDTDNKVLFHLIPADENILYFSNEKGELLTGNADFSYSLNREI